MYILGSLTFLALNVVKGVYNEKYINSMAHFCNMENCIVLKEMKYILMSGVFCVTSVSVSQSYL